MEERLDLCQCPDAPILPLTPSVKGRDGGGKTRQNHASLSAGPFSSSAAVLIEWGRSEGGGATIPPGFTSASADP